MIPGHPFFTEQLDRQRTEQRLVLAGIPDRTLEAVGANRADPVLPEPTGRVETTLRRLAGPLIEAVPEKVLEDLALPVERQALLTWAQEEVDWSTWPNQVADMVGDAASTSRDDAAVAAQLVERHDEELTWIAALLVLADDLADDYVDPRIKRWRDRRATST